MKALFTLLFNLIIITMYAQPVISDSWIPQIDDVWRQSVTFETPEPGESGANINWDFSDVNVDNFYFEILFNWIDPAGTPYVDSFPESNICANFEGFAYGYYRSDESQFEYLGSGSEFGTDLFTDPQTFRYIGMDFETTVVDSYEVVRYNNFFDPTMTKGATSYTYDAYGTLVLPNVTISDAIRIFSIDIETDSSSSGALSTVRGDSTTTYAWIADGSVFPVAQWQRTSSYLRLYINGDLLSEDIEEPEITFSINPDYSLTSSVAGHEPLPALDVFPTIARDEVNVRFDVGSPLDYIIYSMTGSPMDRGFLSGDVTAIDIGQFGPGYYVLQVDGYASNVFLKME
jgi:hypothetical protein